MTDISILTSLSGSTTGAVVLVSISFWFSTVELLAPGRKA